MNQLKLILSRLKNPSVILSILSEVITILMLLNVNVNIDLVTGIVTAVCSILVLLGILSNPTAQNRGYGDDVMRCENCGKDSLHVQVNGKMVCIDCGEEKTDE